MPRNTSSKVVLQVRLLVHRSDGAIEDWTHNQSGGLWSITSDASVAADIVKIAKADQVASLDEARLKREMKARFVDLSGLLDRHVSTARRLLRTLMEHPLRCEAVREGDRKEYRVTGTGSYLPLLPETLAPLNSAQGSCSVVDGVPNGI